MLEGPRKTKSSFIVSDSTYTIWETPNYQVIVLLNLLNKKEQKVILKSDINRVNAISLLHNL